MSQFTSTNLRLQNLLSFVERLKTSRLFTFIGKSSVWDDEGNPDTAVEGALAYSAARDDLIMIKEIDDSYITVPRIDWVTSTVYPQYDDQTNVSGCYVMNDTFEVYKCLDNNGGAQSTTKPTGTLTTPIVTADGYVWKFMYDVSLADQANRLTSSKLPVSLTKWDDGTNQWLVQAAAVAGAVERVDVSNAGSGYSQGLPPVLDIAGDGTGFAATVSVNPDGTLDKVTVTNAGSGYTTMTITINTTGTTGTGGVLRPVYSPEGGHGSNAANELYATTLTTKSALNLLEGGAIPSLVSYRQVGLILDPKSNTAGVKLAMSAISWEFDVGETVTGGASGATGIVDSYDPINNSIILYSVVGTFVEAETITGGTTGATGVCELVGVQNLTPSAATAVANLDQDSGDILYLENRTSIQRADTDNEQIRISIEF